MNYKDEIIKLVSQISDPEVLRLIFSLIIRL